MLINPVLALLFEIPGSLAGEWFLFLPPLLFSLDSDVFLPCSCSSRSVCIWKFKKKKIPSKGKIFQVSSHWDPCNLFYPFLKQILKAWNKWMAKLEGISFFNPLFLWEFRAFPITHGGWEKLEKDLFKDFCVCSLMFQDAFGMTAHMSWFLHESLHIQKQSKENSLCADERATMCQPKLSVSFSSWAAELGNSLKMYSPKISSRTFPNI